MAEGSLDGVLVVELCQSVSGPYGSQILAQLGARVIKVERPGVGDDTRTWGPPFWNGESAMFLAMNSDKESITLDVTDEKDRKVLEGLIADADVLIQNWRPGKLDSLGLGPSQVAELNPRLIYCTITGFGDSGPLAEAPGYDPLIQAFSGLMSVTGQDGNPPVRVGTSIIDMGTGLWSALAILAALRQRDQTGSGTPITISLLEVGLAWLPYQINGYLGSGVTPRRMGSGLPMIVPYQAFECSDGRHLVVAAGNDNLWERLCDAIGRPDLAGDEKLASNPGRVAHRDHVVAELSETLATRSVDGWLKVLETAGVPCSPVHSIAEVMDHPQTDALGMLRNVHHASIDDLRLLGLPFSLGGHRPGPTRSPPGLDEHREDLD